MAFCASCGKELPVDANVCPNCGTPVPGRSAPMGGANPSSGSVSGFDTLTKDQKAQDYWIRRIVAYVIDAIIVFVAVFIIFGLLALAALPFFVFGAFAPFALLFGTFALLGGILFILYFTLAETMYGATIGKNAFHLKVVNKTGSKPSFSEAFIRNLSKIYWLLLLLDVIVGLAMSKGYQQKYSDQFVGTSVVPK